VFSNRISWVGYLLLIPIILFSSRLFAQDYIVKGGLKSKGSVLDRGTRKENGRIVVEKIGKERVKYFKKIKKKYVVTDVNPKNKPSENNILACGFKFTKKSKSRRRKSKVMLNHYILKL